MLRSFDGASERCHPWFLLFNPALIVTDCQYRTIRRYNHMVSLAFPHRQEGIRPVYTHYDPVRICPGRRLQYFFNDVANDSVKPNRGGKIHSIMSKGGEGALSPPDCITSSSARTHHVKK